MRTFYILRYVKFWGITEDDEGVGMNEGDSDDDGPDNSFMAASRLLKNMNAPKFLPHIDQNTKFCQETDQVLMHKNNLKISTTKSVTDKKKWSTNTAGRPAFFADNHCATALSAG